MTRNDDVAALSGRSTEQSDHFGSRQRIEAVQGFIEHEHFRIVRQGLRETDSLAHALAVGRDFAGGGIDHVDALNGFPGKAFGILKIHARKAEIGVQELKSGETLRESVELSRVAYDLEEIF